MPRHKIVFRTFALVLLLVMILGLITCVTVNATTIYLTTRKSEAEVIVYQSPNLSGASMVVKLTGNRALEESNPTYYWRVTYRRSEADRIVYFTTKVSEADLIVYCLPITYSKPEGDWRIDKVKKENKSWRVR